MTAPASLHALLDLAFAAKAQGHDLFVEYMPHVGNANASLHLYGWRHGKDPDHRERLFRATEENASEAYARLSAILANPPAPCRIPVPPSPSALAAELRTEAAEADENARTHAEAGRYEDAAAARARAAERRRIADRVEGVES